VVAFRTFFCPDSNPCGPFRLLLTRDINQTRPLFTINFRYKQPTATSSQALDLQIFDTNTEFEKAGENMRFAASVSAYGLVMRNSAYKGDATYEKVRTWATAAMTYDPYEYRKEFIQLIDKAKQ